MTDKISELPTDRHFLELSETCLYMVILVQDLSFGNRKKSVTKLTQRRNPQKVYIMIPNQGVTKTYQTPFKEEKFGLQKKRKNSATDWSEGPRQNFFTFLNVHRVTKREKTYFQKKIRIFRSTYNKEFSEHLYNNSNLSQSIS